VNDLPFLLDVAEHSAGAAAELPDFPEEEYFLLELFLHDPLSDLLQVLSVQGHDVTFCLADGCVHRVHARVVKRLYKLYAEEIGRKYLLLLGQLGIFWLDVFDPILQLRLIRVQLSDCIRQLLLKPPTFSVHLSQCIDML